MDNQKLNVVEYQKHIEESLKNLTEYTKSQTNKAKKYDANEKMKKWLEGIRNA